MSDGGSTRRTGTATVLFTDLAGSTEARSRLGEEAADELHRQHERLLATEISAHRGVVVKTLGDGVMATFGSAANAVAAAIAIQQTVADVNDELEAPLRVRIGISAGDVAWRGKDCTGTPVIEAARLCNVAGPGEIVIADIVQAMARGRGGHAFVPLGTLELKGLADPVPASRVRWAGDKDGPTDGPEAPTVATTAATATVAAPVESGGAPHRPNRRVLLIAVGAALVLALAIGGVALAVGSGDDGDSSNDESDVAAFCEVAVTFDASSEDAIATLDQLEAAAPDDEIRGDVVTIRDSISGTATGPEAQTAFDDAVVSFGSYLTENCPAE